jgi:hypothetical protein
MIPLIITIFTYHAFYFYRFYTTVMFKCCVQLILHFHSPDAISTEPFSEYLLSLRVSPVLAVKLTSNDTSCRQPCNTCMEAFSYLYFLFYFLGHDLSLKFNVFEVPHFVIFSLFLLLK